MDPDNSISSRVERTFWTAWYYITGAVSRLLRPEPADVVSPDPESNNEPAAIEDELDNSVHAEEDASAKSVYETHSDASGYQFGLSRASVSWDLCTTEIDHGLDEESVQYRREKKDAEATGVEELFQTGESEIQLQSEEPAGDQEETERVLRTVQGMEETNIQAQIGDCEEDSEAEIEVKLCKVRELSLEEKEKTGGTAAMHEKVGKSGNVQWLTSEKETESNEAERQVETQLSEGKNQLQMTFSYGSNVSEQELVVPGQDPVMAHRSKSGVAVDVTEMQGESTTEKREDEVVIEEENEDEDLYEVPKQEDKIHTVTDDKDIGETDNVHAEVVNEKPGVNTEDMSAGERLPDRDHTRKDDEAGTMKNSRTKTSVVVKPEGETGLEMNTELKNRPLIEFEGRDVVLQELNPQTLEEAQEGVPAFNNEPGLDEHTIEGFLEEGDPKEVRNTQLPEKVVSKDPESLQNNRAEYLMQREHAGEEQGSTEVIPFNLVGVQLLQDTLVQKPFVEEDVELFADPMKTGIDHFEKEFQPEDVLTNEEHLEVGTEPKECYDAGESLEMTREDTFKFLEAEVQKMTEKLDFQLEEDNAGQNRSRTSSLCEDIMETGSLEQSLESDFVDRKDVEIAVEDQGYVEQRAEGLVDPTVTEMVAEYTTETDDKEDDLIAVSESLETTKRLSDAEVAPEWDTNLEDETVTSSEKIQRLVKKSEDSCEESFCPTSGSQDVIDEEILDLWMKTLSDEDKKIRPQTRKEVEDFDEEPRKISSAPTEMEVSDADVSSSTAESGFSDQSISEWGTQNCEAQQPTLRGVQDILVNVSESMGVSELSMQRDFGSETLVVLETSHLEDDETVSETKLYCDPGEVRPLDEESDETKERTDEDTGRREEMDDELTDFTDKIDQKDEEQPDVGALFHDQKSKVECEPVDLTTLDSLKEIQHIDSAPAPSDTDASSEEGIESSGSSSQDETSTNSEKTSVKFPTHEGTQPGDHIEVDDTVLDFTAQKSRISVKNPRVRAPKDPRSLLHMPSMDPTPAVQLPVKAAAGVPFGGIGFGVKLPGLGAGFPVLKKSKQTVREETSQESISQGLETKQEMKSDPPEEDETQRKPKWMPQRHPGFGNPLMSELKTKLKKATKD